MKTMYYLACPYSHESVAVREFRFECANRIAAGLMASGHHVFSPISHSHPIAAEGLAGDFEFWREWNLSMMDRCDALMVLQLDGWADSVGVSAEIEHAKQTGMTIEWIGM